MQRQVSEIGTLKEQLMQRDVIVNQLRYENDRLFSECNAIKQPPGQTEMH
jgi:hypothetical protein